ncbi:hypothetical protein NEISICOT_00011 [Neisseria sicca ATCC 29256]|uniref:Uncharacterized protein n=1 Tax=Neisseria sicca ATCC 29256 TaxID=547045 RepID=C6M0I7_NEISI|nr:hypothetical protein NEISICOT_00011 [Neisseria sicca ATCC 29256]
MPRLAVLSVLSAASSPCPDLNLIHYIKNPPVSQPNVSKSPYLSLLINKNRQSSPRIFKKYL